VCICDRSGCPGSAGRGAGGGGEAGADPFALGGRKMVGVGVYGDGDAREPPASPESDAHRRAHVGQGRSPDASGIPLSSPKCMLLALPESTVTVTVMDDTRS